MSTIETEELQINLIKIIIPNKINNLINIKFKSSNFKKFNINLRRK